MKNPFERERRLRDERRAEPELEAALRASLDAHARQAPDGDELAEQIIASASSASSARRPARASARRTFPSAGRYTLPAAAAILAAIVGIAIAFFASSPGPDTPPVAETTTAPAPSVSPTGRPSVVTPSTTSPRSSTSAPVDTSALHEVQVIDLTFTASDDGWALASARCIQDPSARCTAMMHTTDGVNWASLTGPSVNVAGIGKPCPCAEHVRFATDRIGYVFGPGVLYTTTDGGQSWRQQQGGADALETVKGTVLLVTGGTVRHAPIGTASWTTSALPGSVPSTGRVTLARSGDLAVLEIGAAVFRSGDDGGTWRRVSDPCGGTAVTGGGTGGTAVTAATAADGSSTVVIACETGGSGSTITSTNGGRTFASPARGATLGPATLLTAPDVRTQLVLTDRLYRSTDAGSTWHAVSTVPDDVTFLGFENDRIGRAVTDGGRKIWTTRTGGMTWTKVDLP